MLRKLTLYAIMLVCLFAFTVQESEGTASIAVVISASGTTATITTDATTASYHIQGGTIPVGQMINDASSILLRNSPAKLVVSLVNSATPKNMLTQYGKQTSAPSTGYFTSSQTFDNVKLELLGHMGYTSPSDDEVYYMVPIGVVNHYVEPAIFDITPYNYLVLRFWFIDAGIGEFTVFLKVIADDNFDYVQAKE